MSSSLFRGTPQQSRQPQRQNNDLITAVDEVKRQIGNQNPNIVLQQMCQHDPQVRAFVQSVQNLNPMQLAAQFFGKR